MRYRRLGRTDLELSQIGLGTMTWGEQNTEAEAHAQLDRAVAAGVNFIDTAEIYPVPPRAATCGRTEEYLGRWLKRSGNRERVILATKVAGPADWLPHVRGGRLRLERTNIEAAVDASLRRLNTDCIDLYQLHWPDRNTNFFGRLGYTHRADERAVPIEETLEVLTGLIDAGKIRYVGVSNETPWGVMTYLRAAERMGLPRIVSIQNPYSLLNRTFEIALAEISHREDVGLLAYSPLGFGVLSGKYVDGNRPPGARLTLFDRFRRYLTPQGVTATADYVQLARRHGLSPAQMALAFVQRQPFVISTLIGATTAEQLEENLASAELELAPEVLDGIEAIHARYPNPCP